MQIKIIYDPVGPGYNAKVINAETGELIEGVTVVDLHIDTTSIPVSTLYINNVLIDVTALAVIATPFTETTITKFVEADNAH